MAKNPQLAIIPDSEILLPNDLDNWNKKKQDLMLNLGLTSNSDSDQTPTPTRFIRNCEEVGLFQDLQNVNPFDESFKNAVENPAASVNSQLATSLTDDTLHTPQIYPDNTLERSNNTFNDSEPLVQTKDAENSSSIIKAVPIKRLLDPKRQVKWQKEANKASQIRCRKRKQLEIENMREENAMLKRENDNLLRVNAMLQKRVAELEAEVTQQENSQNLKPTKKPVFVKMVKTQPAQVAIAPKKPAILPQPVASTVIVLCQPSVPSSVVRLS
ncbi:uncharacterized protein LOC126734064 [Anthonomus grandis grandis]|uniref:uncharacterized protein LOC126734064 n=1 Tax=Anthonomus grandis grandis TaxID=2921223 RepID=UPI002165016B|nr:uncharacterized protein LOC126734064 [Anthonomus grandis grandis]